MVNLKNKEYYAFISYSHKDEEWAKWIQHEFEHYHLPTTLNGWELGNLPDKFRPIFRDIDELSGGELKPQITRALKASAYLVIICSPNSAKSLYVNDEIRQFIEVGKEMGVDNIQNIFPFIIEGIPHSPDNECFPQALRDLPTELIAGDVTKHGREHAFVKILSGTLHDSRVSFGTLWNQFERDRIEAERKEREQKDNLLRIQSLFLAEKATSLYNNNEYDLVNLIALEALPKNIAEPDRPYVREAEDVLRKSSVYTTPIIRTSASWKNIHTNGNIVATQEDDYKIKILNVKDGEVIETIDLEDWVKENYQALIKSETLDSYLLKNNWLKSIAFPGEKRDVMYICTIDSLLSINWNERPINPQLLNKQDYIADSASILFSHDNLYYFWLRESYNRFYVSLHDATSNKEIFSYHESAKSSVTFSPNNKLIAFACHKDIHVYDIDSRKANNSSYLAKYRCYNPTLCTFVDDTNILIVRDDNSIELWNFLSDQVVTIHKSRNNILDIQFRDNLVTFVTSANEIIVLDIRYNLMIAHLKWSRPVKLLSLSNDGEYVYFRDESSFRTWDFRVRINGDKLLYYHDHMIDHTAYSQDKSYFVSVSENCAKIWDVEQNQLVNSIPLEMDNYIREILVSKKHNKIILSSDRVYCMDIHSGNIVPFDKDDFGKIFLSADEKYIFKSLGTIIQIFDVESLAVVREIALPEDHSLEWSESMAFHPYETLMVTATTCYNENLTHNMVLTVWNYESGTSIASIAIEDYYGDDFVCFSENGDSVILNKEYQWDYKTDRLNKLESPINQTPCNKIENDGFFVVATEYLPLQQVIDKTRMSLGNRELTSEERSTYYLD